jgi:hypothetical protein
MNRDLLVVGALGHGAPGAAYVFERRTSGFEQVQKLTIATDNAFGAPVAVSGSDIFVGSADPGTDGYWGAVHSYERPGSAWVASTVFSAPKEYGFGTAIAANEQRLAMATYFGTLYIYERTASGFVQPAVLEPPPETTGDGGAEVAIGDSAVVVGLPYDDYESQVGAGRAYISFFGTGDWSAPTWLPYTGAGIEDNAGRAVAVVTDAAFAGAPYSRLSTTGGIVRAYGPCGADAECASGSYCGAEGACRGWKDDGAACDARAGADCRQADCRVCRSGLCVDGVCCGSPCDAPCEACAEPGSEGTCIAVTAPRTGKSCTASVGLCGGFCNGVDRGCVYPAVGVPCQAECSNGIETASHCDGLGSCVASAPRSCGGYACRDGACATECARDEECVLGFICAQGVCVVAQRPACSADGTASTSTEGTTPCSPYRCNETTGACQQACASTRACAEKYLCDTERRACVLQTAIPEEGCGCRLQRKTSSRMGWLLTLGIVGLARRRCKWSAHRRRA